MEGVSGIVLKVPYPKMGNTADIEILGKTCMEWVKFALGDCYTADVVYDEGVPLPVLVRRCIDRESIYTVVLYSDTPLITKKTVLDAVKQLEDGGKNVLKMTRGYVFKTAFLANADNIYSDDTCYFDEEDFVTAFNFRQVSLITDILKNRIISYHMENGVHFEDCSTTYIGSDVVIGSGVKIAPDNTILGKTVINDNAVIKCGNVIEDCIVDNGAIIDSSRLYRSYIGKGTTVGPFAYVRPDCVVGARCRIGDFVELKKSVIGDGCKISHLSYVGDCEMGKGCNVGCGVVFINYDGKDKFKSRVGDNVFIGSNSNIIAPLDIADGAFIAAGSTLTDNVPESALAIARARQVNKPSWTGNKFASKDGK